MFFISLILQESRLLVAITRITSTISDYKEKRKIDFVLLLPSLFYVFLK